MKILIRLGSITFVLFLFASCANNTSTSNNYSKLYSGGTSTLIQPQFTIYHHKEDSSKFIYQISTEGLLYVRKDKVEPFSARINIKYYIYESIHNQRILDSATTKLVDENNNKTAHYLNGEVSFKQSIGQRSVLKIITTDENRKSVNEQLFFINKENTSSRQFFLVLEDDTKKPLFKNYISVNKNLRIVSELNKNKKVFAQIYHRNFPIAAPPFSSTNPKPFKYKADLTASIQLNDEGKTFIKGPDSGFVHLQTDTTSKNGFTIYRFKKYFPLIKTAEDMIYPLRYISTTNEYNGLLETTDNKKAVDNYWLKKCGTASRGRDIIKAYYNRVQDANKHFTSYLEGWATDRGMIYIVFGKPGVINKTSTSESWIYGAESNMMALRFDFDKVDNPFTDNDYKLQRNISFRSNWYRAVDSWRSGRMYWLQ